MWMDERMPRLQLRYVGTLDVPRTGLSIPSTCLPPCRPHMQSCLAISWKAARSSRCSSPLRRTTPTTLSAAVEGAAGAGSAAGARAGAAVRVGLDVGSRAATLCFAARVCSARSMS